jgi:uncharacterized protein with ParB-like and HNH nuclease domain
MKLIKIDKKVYNKLSYLPFNRKYQVRQDLFDSMNKFGFTVPIILVESAIYGKKEIYVADGQHRLTTAMYLEIDAYGVIVDTTLNNVSDLVKFVASLNSAQKEWTLQDYVNSYAYLNLHDYVELLRIKNTTPYSVNLIANLLVGIRKNGGVSESVKNSTFKINHKENALNTLSLAAMLSKYEKVTGRMLLALNYVSSLREFNQEIFVEKFKENAKKVKELKLDDYTDIFTQWIK